MVTSLHTFISFGILCLIFDSRVCQSLSTTSLSRTDGLQQRLRQLASEGGMILLDGDNVRGKTKFKLSKEGILDGQLDISSTSFDISFSFAKII
jgi:tRNA A37 threonylcarbamoyladenosine biosynthesis protein TsaE